MPGYIDVSSFSKSATIGAIVRHLNEGASLSEPPILPNINEPPNENPFAPSFVARTDYRTAKIHLDVAFWIAVVALLVTSVILSWVGIPLGWVGVFATIAAAIRVPLLQRKYPQELSGLVNPGQNLPPPLALLFTSLAMNSVFIVVSFIAFAAVCIPSTLAFGIGDPGNVVVAISGIIGLLFYCLMFFLSLRLRF